MSKRVMFKSMVVAVLAIGVAPIVYSQSAPTKENVDAWLGAPNAEMSATSKEDDGEAVSIKPVRPRRRSDAVGDSSDEQLDNPGKSASQDSNEVDVTVMGKGETAAEAKLDAFRSAVEKAVGVWVDAESLMEKDELLKDRVNTISNADIKKYEMLKEWRFKSGLFGCKIKAWVEKKAITPKFADVFPAAFADVGEEASTIHVQKVTRAKRSGDAASLMTAELEGVDRMRNWVRLSVVKGKALEEVKKIHSLLGGRDIIVNEVPGKGLYSVRYSMKIDENAYFKGFLPHFKEVLRKMQEGEAEEDVLLTSAAYSDNRFGNLSETDDGGKILKTSMGVWYLNVGGFRTNAPSDLSRFLIGGGIIGGTYFVNPIILSGFPGVENGRNSSSFNIWVLDKMNKYMTSVRCSAYKVPESALQAYWKNLFETDDRNVTAVKASAKVEVQLLDKDNEEIAARIDHVPGALLVHGWDRELNSGDQAKRFVSFFIRPLFIADMSENASGYVYSTEIQRDVYFPLTDAQLERVTSVKVRFVGGKRK